MRQNKKNRIKILVPIRNPVGGIRTFLKYTHGNLDKDTYEFTFLVSSEEWLNRIKNDFKGFRINAFCTKRENSTGSMLLSMVSLLVRNKYHIIHSQGLTAGMIGVITNVIFRRPHVITLHQVFGEGYSIDEFFMKYAQLKKYIIQIFLRNVDVIHCVSDDAKKNLLNFFPCLQRYEDKIITIRNGINVKELQVDYEMETQPFKKNRSNFYIGFIGRYMPQKGFQYVIDAIDIMVNQLKVLDIRVICVGGVSGYIREYKKDIDKKAMSKYFEFLDFFENIAPILKHLDLLLMPSLAEACPLLPMEALVCGTPIVAFSCIGLREVLKDTPAQMVPAGDLKSLIKAVLDIKKSYSEVKKEFDNFMDQARERYDVTNAVAKLDELFRKLAKT